MTKLMQEYKDKIFRMWEYRRPGDWTPYEMEKKFSDESMYVDFVCTFVKVIDAYEIPNDLLIKLQVINEEDSYYDDNDVYIREFEPSDRYLFIPLSKMKLEFYLSDNKGE